MNEVRLKKREDRRIRRGHPWVYSNEVGVGLKGLRPGEVVRVCDNAGRPLGQGYANPHTLIAVRMLTRGDETFTLELLRKRVSEARSLRERLLPKREAYRAVYSESDMLPGLVVDRYGAWLSVQSLTNGIEAMLPDILDALKDEFRPEGIVLKNDSAARRLEGLDNYTQTAHGSWAGPVGFDICGMRLSADLMEGQKTGFFLDQADNYSMLDGLAAGGRALDLFCHGAPWSVYAALGGAASVTAVDSSARSLEIAAGNAAANGVEGRVSLVQSDAFLFMKDPGGPFDVTVCDPPAFVKSRSALSEGLKGYRDINVKAMRSVRPGGFLISCSCSRNVSREKFIETLHAASVGADRTVRIIETRSQSRDHPVLLAAPETEYLKCVLMQVL